MEFEGGLCGVDPVLLQHMVPMCCVMCVRVCVMHTLHHACVGAFLVPLHDMFVGGNIPRHIGPTIAMCMLC